MSVKNNKYKKKNTKSQNLKPEPKTITINLYIYFSTRNIGQEINTVVKL